MAALGRAERSPWYGGERKVSKRLWTTKEYEKAAGIRAASLTRPIAAKVAVARINIPPNVRAIKKL
jgi:hypothetical protein